MQELERTMPAPVLFACLPCCFVLTCCFRSQDEDERQRLRNRFAQKIVMLDGKVHRQETMPAVGTSVPGSEWEDPKGFNATSKHELPDTEIHAGPPGSISCPSCSNIASYSPASV